MIRVAGLFFTVLLSGCLAPGVSDASATWEFPAPSQASAVRVKVMLPAELRRPTLVTRDGDSIVNHDLDRWGAPLGDYMSRAIAADLSEIPVQDVLIEVQRLEVSPEGNYTLLFVANLRLEQGPNAPGAPLTVRSKLLQSRAQSDVGPLESAFVGYLAATSTIGEVIAEAVAQEQGGVAKPAPGVTVPGK